MFLGVPRFGVTRLRTSDLDLASEDGVRERQRGERAQRQPLARDGGHVGEVRQVPRRFRRRQRVANGAEPNEILLGFAILNGSVRMLCAFTVFAPFPSFDVFSVRGRTIRRATRGKRRGRLRQIQTHAHHVPAVPPVHVPQRVDVVQTLDRVAVRVIDDGRHTCRRLAAGRSRRVSRRRRLLRVVVVVVQISAGLRKRLFGIRLAHEDHVVVVEAGHLFLAQDELHDVEPIHALARKHRPDRGRVVSGRSRLLLVPAARDLRRALLQHQRLEHVEVFRDGRERLRDVAQSAPTRGVRARLAVVHGEVVPGKHLLLQPGQVRGLLLRGERHGLRVRVKTGRSDDLTAAPRRRVAKTSPSPAAVLRARTRRAKAGWGRSRAPRAPQSPKPRSAHERAPRFE